MGFFDDLVDAAKKAGNASNSAADAIGTITGAVKSISTQAPATQPAAQTPSAVIAAANSTLKQELFKIGTVSVDLRTALIGGAVLVGVILLLREK